MRGHHEHGAAGAKHFCRANLVYKVNKGHHGNVSLDGAKFWVSSDLGADFSKGQDYCRITVTEGSGMQQVDITVARLNAAR